jgi:hypothetical protein
MSAPIREIPVPPGTDVHRHLPGAHLFGVVPAHRRTVPAVMARALPAPCA